MAEYITKEAAIEAFENGEADVIEDYGDGCDFGFGLKNIKSTINAIPAADVVPVSALRTLRDELYENDRLTMVGLRQLNALIAMHDGGNDDG